MGCVIMKHNTSDWYIEMGIEHLRSCYGENYLPEDELDWLEIIGKLVEHVKIPSNEDTITFFAVRSHLEDAINTAIYQLGYKVKSVDRIILAFGPTITDDYEVVIQPMEVK